jgi:hypothetical protein
MSVILVQLFIGSSRNHRLWSLDRMGRGFVLAHKYFERGQVPKIVNAISWIG